MAIGKVKTYFKNLRKMMEETKQKTRPTGSGTGKGINVKTPGKGQSGVGVTKQGKKPKKGDEIKQPPLEAKHVGEVNLDNVKKVNRKSYAGTNFWIVRPAPWIGVRAEAKNN